MKREFGRRVDFDERSRDFPMRALLPVTKKPRAYTWNCAEWLDQGPTSSCVGFSWTHELIARPAVEPANKQLAYKIYAQAQKIDPWPGEEPNVQGTSILAGAKIVQRLGYMGEYRWCFTLHDLIMSVGYNGPVVVGTWWHSSMSNPDSKGRIAVSGDKLGGHAYLIKGVSVRNREFRIHNSWGRNYGYYGDAFISWADMERLLRDEGEACVPVKRIRSY